MSRWPALHVRSIGAALLALVTACEPLPALQDTDGAPDDDTSAGTESETDAKDDTEDDGPGGGTTVSGMQRSVDLGTATSNNGGIAEFTVHVEEGDTEFLFFGAAEGSWLSIERLKGPDGKVITDWQDWDGRQQLADSFWPYVQDVAFSWPMRAEDGPLVPGDYTVQVATTDKQWEYVSDVDVAASVRIKQDPDLTAGTVHARIVYTGGLDGDAEIVAAVEGAVARWKEIWAPYGLTLAETYTTDGVDADLGYPDWNSTDILGVSQDLDGQSVQLLVGELVDGDPWTYGVSGGIPGPLDASPRSAVVTSYLAHAGNNGRFDDDEIRLMGETFAHEIGHYMGLQHPVQGGWNDWDALGDTVECTSSKSCEADLGDNLMYPFSICPSFDYCEPQFDLTADQQAELHYYGATL